MNKLEGGGIPPELVLKIHDQCMSSDPEKALIGRLRKHITVAFMSAIDDELDRNTDARLVTANVMMVGMESYCHTVASVLTALQPVDYDFEHIISQLAERFEDELRTLLKAAQEAKREAMADGEVEE